MRSGTKYLLVLGVLFLLLWLLGRLVLPIALPFLLGLGLALAAEPLVNLLCGPLRLPRGAGAGIGITAAFLLAGCLILSLLALVLQQLKALAQVLPDLALTAETGLQNLKTWLLELSDLAPLSIRSLLRQNVAGLFSGGTGFLANGAAHLPGLIGDLITQLPDQALTLGTAVLSGFMISAKLPRLRLLVEKQLQRPWIRTLADFLRQTRTTLGRWLTAQLKLAGVTFTILTLGFILLAIPYAPLWALAVALLDALPVLGTGTVLVPWGIISLLGGARARGIGLLSTYVVVLLTRTMLEPRLVGRHLGLDPLLTLVSLYLGYRLWGFFGMILSPLLAVTALQLLPQAGKAGEPEL